MAKWTNIRLHSLTTRVRLSARVGFFPFFIIIIIFYLKRLE